MGKKLAIQGHSTRGKEVIELLEMMGGRDVGVLKGDHDYYVIDECENNLIKFYGHNYIHCHEFVVLTLEEFLEKYPFKVGDKVFIYDNITEGCVTGMKWDGDKGTVKYCVYTSAECWYDAKELLKWDNVDLVERYYMDNMKDKAKAPDMKGEDYSGKRFGYKIPDGYEFDVVVDGKIFLKPIKPKYPTTYVECCEKINACPIVSVSYDSDEDMLYNDEVDLTLLTLRKLLICCKTYWKIAGEEMGLDGPWNPDWNDATPKYTIVVIGNDLVKHYSLAQNYILAFPTEEMRDVFYENFKDLIEQCKEFL